MPRTRLAGLAALAIAITQMAAQAALETPEGIYARYRICLEGAAETGAPLVVHLHARDGRPTTGWASRGTAFGRVLDHGLRRKGDRLIGPVDVLLGAVRYRYRLDVPVGDAGRKGGYEGTCGTLGAGIEVRGSVEGRVEPLAVPGRPFRLEAEFASMYTRYGHMRHPRAEVSVRGGRVREGTFGSRSTGRRAYSGELRGGRALLAGGRLEAALQVAVISGDAAKGVYTFSVDEPVTCNFVRGTYKAVSAEGDVWGVHGFGGRLWGLEPEKTQDTVFALTLPGGIEGTGDVLLLIQRSGSALGPALARGGNAAVHEVDVTGLQVAENRLSGAVKVTYEPVPGADPRQDWPPGARDVRAEYTLDVTFGETGLKGSYKGTYGVVEARMGEGRAVELSEEDLRRAFAAPR